MLPHYHTPPTDLTELMSEEFAQAQHQQIALEDNTRAQHGVVYTPPHIAHFIVKRALAQHGVGARAYDPACGSGIFLLSLLLHKIDAEDPHRTSSTCGEKILSEEIFGSDINSASVGLARSLLIQAFSKIYHQAPSLACIHALEQHVLQEDPLLKPPLQERQYDVIVGNPPYVLSRGGEFTQQYKRQLKGRFSAVLAGRINLYLLFMAYALEVVAKHGTISYIVPNAWLGIQEAEKVRRLLLQRGLHEVIIPQFRVFKDHGVETVIFTLTTSRAGQPLSVAHLSEGSEEPQIVRTLVPTEILSESPRAEIELSPPSYLDQLYTELCKTALRLDSDESPFTPKIAAQIYAQGKGIPPQTAEDVRTHPFHTTQRVDDSSLPYYQGGDIKRFGLSWSGLWLRYGPWVSEYQPRERFEKPRVVVREILGKAPYRIQAAVITEPALYNKSVLHILPKYEMPETWLYALVAILNAPITSELLAKVGKKSGRTLFPKLLRADLAALFIPRAFEQHVPKLSALTRELANGSTPDLEHALESAVKEALGICSE
jgi:methylase of polypeptide subunit release factors